MAAHNQWVLKTRSISYCTTSVFPSAVTDLVLIYESVTSSASVVHWLTLHSWTLNSLENDEWKTTIHSQIKVNVTLRLTVSQSVSLDVEPSLGLMKRYLLLFDSYGLVLCGAPSLTRGRVCHMYMLLTLSHWRSQSQSHIATDGQSVSQSWCRAPSAAHDQIFITVWQLRSCFLGAPSLTRRRVCLFCMLVALAGAVFLGSVSLGTPDHILLSRIWDFPFTGEWTELSLL
jgi:hypothetical protein